MTSTVADKWQGIVAITRADKPLMVTYLCLPNGLVCQSYSTASSPKSRKNS